MTTYVLDMNDSELRIARVGNDAYEVIAQSTGFALIEDRTILFGDTALKQFRLHPRQINNQFWNRLSMDPLAVRGPNTANHADLVYRHFDELVRQAAVTARRRIRHRDARHDDQRTTLAVARHRRRDRRHRQRIGR